MKRTGKIEEHAEYKDGPRKEMRRFFEEEDREKLVAHGEHQVVSRNEMRRISRLPSFSPIPGKIYLMEGKPYVYDKGKDLEEQRYISENRSDEHLELKETIGSGSELSQQIFSSIGELGQRERKSKIEDSEVIVFLEDKLEKQVAKLRVLGMHPEAIRIQVIRKALQTHKESRKKATELLKKYQAGCEDAVRNGLVRVFNLIDEVEAMMEWGAEGL